MSWVGVRGASRVCLRLRPVKNFVSAMSVIPFPAQSRLRKCRAQAPIDSRHTSPCRGSHFSLVVSRIFRRQPGRIWSLSQRIERGLSPCLDLFGLPRNKRACTREVFLRLATQRKLHSGESSESCARRSVENAHNEVEYTPNPHARVKQLPINFEKTAGWIDGFSKLYYFTGLAGPICCAVAVNRWQSPVVSLKRK